MKKLQNYLLAVTALALLALFVSISPAAAQQSSAFRGKFTLSSEVDWQGKVLPVGEYTFSLSSASLSAQIIIHGVATTAIILPVAISKHKAIQASALRIENRGGLRYVRQLDLAKLDLVVRFAIPKVSKQQDEREFARGAAATEQVLIATVKK